MHRDVYVAHLAALLEQLVDVNAHKVDGTHVWGFFRAAMYFPLVDAFGPDRVPAELGAKLAAQFEAACKASGLPVAGDALAAQQARSGSDHAGTGGFVSVELVGDVATGQPAALESSARSFGIAGIERASHGDRESRSGNHGPVVIAASGPSHHRARLGLHESPVADAWTSFLINEGHSVLKLDALPAWLSANQPRRYPSVGLPPVTDAERRLAIDIVKERWVPAIAALFARVNPVLQEAIGIGLQSAVAACTERAVSFVAEREAALRWLDITRPRAVLFVCYYETCYLSLISACRARGIPTVDLQHGMNGTVHAAYTHWTALPPDGYDVLPDWFLTWGEASSRNLQRWWKSPSRHKAIVGGRRDLDPTAPLTASPEVAALSKRASAATQRILITLQDEPLDAGLLAEMRSSPANWLWMVRPHPSSVRYPEATAEAATAQLAAAGVTNAVAVPLETGTLSDLMRLADFHVTGTSSSWMDAWVYDVPTAFIHPGAGQVFATEIAEGLAYFVPNSAGLNAVIRSGTSGLSVGESAVVEQSEDAARAALLRIIGTADGQHRNS